MTAIDWAKLTQPFPDSEIKQRPGPGGRTLSYVDARAVAQRLDDILTPAGWNFRAEVAASGVVKGSLEIGGNVREDIGYPNSDDDAEPYKSAVSDALKRCAVLFGIGRHLYDDNKNGHRPAPARPAPVRPMVVAQPVDDEEEDDPWALPIADDNTCAEHGIAWIGQVGDRYHKKPEGGYCRTAPGNVAKPRR